LPSREKLRWEKNMFTKARFEKKLGNKDFIYIRDFF
jgi:hypothetical protein